MRMTLSNPLRVLGLGLGLGLILCALRLGGQGRG
jgi:hypothetical protein